MSGINAPFVVDNDVLGSVVGPIFNPSVTTPDVFAQGLLTQSLNLDPSVPSQVVKLQSSDAELSAFALHGNISHRSGVMSSPNHPATALSVTFSSDGRVSNAVFGTIKTVTADHQQIHATHGFHASFGIIPARKMRNQPDQPDQAERWGCTKVVIGDTRWTPWISCTKVTDVEADAMRNEQPFFCHDFVTDERFVQFTKHTIPIGTGFQNLYDEGYVCKLILRPDGEIRQLRVSGSGNPSSAAVERGKQILLECNAVLKSKMTTIQWLEHHRLAPQVNDVFGWMNGFIASHQRQSMQSLFFGARPMTPSMQTSIWSQLLSNPMAHVKSNKAVNPCKCTPMKHDPACINEFCKFKLAHAHPSILSQDGLKQMVLQRLDEKARARAAAAAAAAKAEADAKAAKIAAEEAAVAKKLAAAEAAAARKLAAALESAAAAARRKSEMAERAVARAASAAKSNTVPVKPAAAKGKPGASARPGASASASAGPGASVSASAAAKPQVESTIKKPASNPNSSKSTSSKSSKKGGSKTRKLKLKSRRRRG